MWCVKMCWTDCLFKLLLFQLFIAWCGAKHVSYQYEGIGEEIQNRFSELLHVGKYSAHHMDPSLVEVVVPVKVSRDGEHLSNVLEHSHEHSHEHSRERRSADEATLHYNLTVAGRDLRLDLRPSLSFVTPSLVVERRLANGDRTQTAPDLRTASCHYRGAVRGQPRSRVAISACDGLAGLLRTEHGEYWIEPSNRIPTEEENLTGRPHVIYKRSAISNHPRTARSINPNPPKNNPQTFDKRRVHNKAYLEKKRRNQILQNNNGNLSPRAAQNEQNLRTNQTMQRLSQRRRLNTPRNKSDEERLSQNNRLQERRRTNTQNNQKKLEAQRRNNELRRLVVNGTYSVRDEDLKAIDKGKELRNLKPKDKKRMRGKKRRRHRRNKNCATKEPPRNLAIYTRAHNTTDISSVNNTHPRHFPHHHALSHRQDFPAPVNSRRTRSVSRAHHVEVLLTADYTMVDFHKEYIETYLLTIMNMVSSLYLDHTIGNSINVVVVKIILLEHPGSDAGLEISDNSDATLASFCKWQRLQNYADDTHRHHYDVGIFITRVNLCGKNDPACSTLGVAHVAGMCQPERSCSVNEDNGLSLAHTITHELGHNFGLYHDTEKIGCLRRVGSTLHIMTPIFEADTVEVAWSRCSRRDVTNFLDAGMAECLLDEPSNSSKLFDYPQLPAGIMFDAQSQCRLVWGEEVHEVCNDPVQSICEHLWCNVNNSCKTNLRGAASGTQCGPDMWCQNQKCVPRRTPPPPQDGGWGEWSAWSQCSRTCGAGVSTQLRRCDRPVPERGGKFCVGERTRYKICNTEPCPNGKLTFREVQCLKYGNDSTPTMDHDEPCELFCTLPNTTAVPPRDYAADGTPCRTGSNDMCISGICRKVGCDWVVESNATVDACGVCNGDGVGCEMVHGIYSKDTTKESGYSEVAVIPAGSRNVKVEEIANSKNYIGIGSAKSRKFYLNGKKKKNMAGEYLVAGSPAIYERDRDWEKVRIQGPIQEDIKIYQMLYRGKHRNPGVTYQYTIDRKMNKDTRHWWKIAGWSQCNTTCGVGVSTRIVHCIDDKNRIVDPERCISEPELQRPQEQAKMCVATPCDPRAPRPAAPAEPGTHWWTGAWSECSHLCYHQWGQRPVRRRGVYCVEKLSNKVRPESYCDSKSKPISQIHCVGLPVCSERFSA